MPTPILIVQTNPETVIALLLNIESDRWCLRQFYSDLPQNSSALITQVDNNRLFFQLYHLSV